MAVITMRYLSQRCETSLLESIPLTETTANPQVWPGSRLECSRIRSCFLSSVRPAQRQVTQARGFALDTDGLLECDGLIDCSFGGGRVGTDLFELPNVIVAACRRGLQRPG